MKRHTKMKIISEKILECEKDANKLYTLVNNLTERVSANPMPENESSTSLPDTFAEFFLSKIEKIRTNLFQIPFYEPRMRMCNNLKHFKKFLSRMCSKLLLA